MVTIYLINSENINAKDLPLRFKNYKPDLKNEQKRISSFIAYEFVKHIACKELNVCFEKISIKSTKNGKPYIENQNDFYFSISHSGNMIAVAISETEIGVDIEKIRKANLKLTHRFFTENEQKYVTNDKDNYNERFFEIWTKKEAYIKYQGTGIDKIATFDVTEKNLLQGFTTLKNSGLMISVFFENKNEIELNCVDKNKILKVLS